MADYVQTLSSSALRLFSSSRSLGGNLNALTAHPFPFSYLTCAAVLVSVREMGDHVVDDWIVCGVSGSGDDCFGVIVAGGCHVVFGKLIYFARRLSIYSVDHLDASCISGQTVEPRGL